MEDIDANDHNGDTPSIPALPNSPGAEFFEVTNEQASSNPLVKEGQAIAEEAIGNSFSPPLGSSFSFAVCARLHRDFLNSKMAYSWLTATECAIDGGTNHKINSSFNTCH